MFLDSLFASLCRIPAVEKHLWRMLYNFLATRPGGDAWEFMNYGYASSGGGNQTARSSPSADSSASLRLYEELASHVPLDGKRLLEVGCGRGGGIHHLRQQNEMARAVGCDLSPQAIALCRQRFSAMPIEWFAGDAEKLPFEAGSFDVVINVESSHCYPRYDRFVAEAHRVLAPGGHFLWTDFRTSGRVAEDRETLRLAGFEEIVWRDITAEVLAAMVLEEPRKEALLQERVPAWLRASFRDFAGMLGSKVHQNFVAGRWRYTMAVLRKP